MYSNSTFRFLALVSIIVLSLCEADSRPDAEADPAFRLISNGETLDEDAIILVSSVVDNKNSEHRAPRQYTGNRANLQRTASSSAKDLVSDIHCVKSATLKTLTAFLHMPEGFSSAPVLEVSSLSDPNLCLITKTNIEDIFALDLSRMDACGVRSCEEQGDPWMCITIRFPILTGLKMPEDEVIDIKCKPQDPAIAGNNVINFQENVVEQRSPAIYIGGGQEFLSEIGLFRKLPGTELFASRVKSGSTIELGENVQLRSIVRSGDGWNFAKITDVVVHRVHDGQALTSPKDTAQLVFSDGCRNPAYHALAPANPWRDSVNGLINNFDFRVFMFQDMDNGDSIMISAKVIACVEEIDCAPIRCGNDPDSGYGRKKRSVPSNTTNDQYVSRTKDWEENLELKIRMPIDLLDQESADTKSFGFGIGRNVSESECKIYLIVTLSVALTFCVLSGAVVMVACFKKHQEVRAASERKRKSIDNEDHVINRNEKSAKEFDDEGGFIKNNVSQFYGRKPGDFPAIHQGSTKPLTVRSVKRRDKAKSEEKNNRLINKQIPVSNGVWNHQPIAPTMEKSMAHEEKAIMV